MAMSVICVPSSPRARHWASLGGTSVQFCVPVQCGRNKQTKIDLDKVRSWGQILVEHRRKVHSKVGVKEGLPETK